jgi:hypothetical protein
MTATEVGEWLLQLITDHHCECEHSGKDDFITRATIVESDDGTELMLTTTHLQTILVKIEA